ncbi:MAG TPA: tetratricopeptide repeat protein [Candidatus Methylomirabilis sp.]|nr:tetratricopeptide repeat protein [Candidatus Methylomirabilis sp.]
MARGRKERASRRPAIVPGAGGPGSGSIPPWLTWGGLALGLLLVGFGLGLLVTRWNSPTGGPPPGLQEAVPEETRTANPGDQAGAGPSADTSARIADLKARLALNPHETPTRLALAHLYLDTGRFAEAITLYQEVLRREPENPDALMHMGTILLRGGHGEEALRSLDRALKGDPRSAHALWDKAQVQATLLGDSAGAIRTWEQFLKVAPGPEDAARVREMMAEARSLQERRPAAAPPPLAGAPAPEPGSLTPDDPTVQAARELLARIGSGPASGAGPPVPGTSAAAPRAREAAAHPGERLFWEKGCGGCHAVRGVGGQMAPDLAGRTRSGGRDVAWHVRFLKEPAAVIPGARMPAYRHLSEQELRTLAEFLVTL